MWKQMCNKALLYPDNICTYETGNVLDALRWSINGNLESFLTTQIES